MKRREIAAKFKLCKNFLCNENAFEEVRTAMHYSVTYSLNLAHILETAYLGVCERVDYELCGNGMIGHGKFFFKFSAVCRLVREEAVKTYSLADTLRENSGARRIKKLIFE